MSSLKTSRWMVIFVLIVDTISLFPGMSFAFDPASPDAPEASPEEQARQKIEPVKEEQGTEAPAKQEQAAEPIPEDSKSEAEPATKEQARQKIEPVTQECTTQSTLASDVEIDYFLETALGMEYDSNSFPSLHRWTKDIKISFEGEPTTGDITTLKQVTSEVNCLLNDITLSMTLTDDSDNTGNVQIYFVPENKFQEIEPNYIPLNYGFFWLLWDATGAIYNARILIASDQINQQERNHLIREELTQILGLMNDSWWYPESIFYQDWTTTTKYAPQDLSLISLLYDSQLYPGMNREQIKSILKQP